MKLKDFDDLGAGGYYVHVCAAKGKALLQYELSQPNGKDRQLTKNLVLGLE